MNNFSMSAHMITVWILKLYIPCKKKKKVGFYPAKKRKTAIRMSQSAEKWEFNFGPWLLND